MPSAVAEAQTIMQARIRDALVAAVSAAWLRLPGYDEEHVAGWLEQVVPMVLAAQSASANMTDAYLAHFLGRQPLGVSASAVTGAALRAGATPQQVYRRPFVNVWTALSKGQDFELAVRAGMARAGDLAATDVQLAHRAALRSVQLKDQRIQAWSRVPDANACAFCRKIAGAKVHSADAMPLHPGCGCTLEPLTEPVPVATALPEGVAVNQHGELGPILGDPAHAFTTV